MAVTYLDTRPASGDTEVAILQKILQVMRAASGVPVSLGDVTLAVSDLEIGAVEIKDGSSDTRAAVKTSDPVAGDPGMVVRNIPSGTQVVSSAQLPAALIGGRLDVNLGSASGSLP